MGFLRANGFEALIFEDAQHFGLGAQTHIAHFVKEDRAAIRFLELAHFALVRQREAALHVSEQPGLDQGLRK